MEQDIGATVLLDKHYPKFPICALQYNIMCFEHNTVVEVALRMLVIATCSTMHRHA